MSFQLQDMALLRMYLCIEGEAASNKMITVDGLKNYMQPVCWH